MQRIALGEPIPSVCKLRPPIYDIRLNNGRRAILEIRNATGDEQREYERAKGGIRGRLYALNITGYNPYELRKLGLDIRDVCCLETYCVRYIDLTVGQDLRSRIEEEVNKQYNRDGWLRWALSLLRG